MRQYTGCGIFVSVVERPFTDLSGRREPNHERLYYMTCVWEVVHWSFTAFREEARPSPPRTSDRGDAPNPLHISSIESRRGRSRPSRMGPLRCFSREQMKFRERGLEERAQLRPAPLRWAAPRRCRTNRRSITPTHYSLPQRGCFVLLSCRRVDAVI